LRPAPVRVPAARECWLAACPVKRRERSAGVF
jgi:hypothetical protein